MPTRSLADALSERLLDAFPPDQAYTEADWAADAMPAPLRHYLTHLLRHHHRRETRQLRRARTDWVNYDHPEMEQAAHAFLDAVDQHMQVPRDQWAETLRTAARRTTNYLVRPVPTLSAFVFEDATGAVPVPQVQWRMRFFGPYAYLRNAVQAFADKQDRDAFTPDAFERVLRRVDERMTADFDADRWLDLLDPLFDTARCATGRTQVPLSLLRTYFEEKKADTLTERLTAYGRTEDADTVAPDALRRLVDAALTQGSSADAPSGQHDAPDAPLDPSLHKPADETSASGSNSSSEAAPQATPMWKQFEQDATQRRTETDTSEDGAQPLWAQFQQRPSDGSEETSTSSSSANTASSSSSAQRSTVSDPDDLSTLEREVFGPSHTPKREVYVDALFDGDQSAYRRVLKRLRTADSWSDASQIISGDVFRPYQVNIYSDAAVHFTNAIEATFR
ncbi:hypothetical protein [Salinibacter grassmerensis]|uniref:hypothetical protein n=1 Tax=Salinibacter grassmerensis TaxID=3040353 RepID=UPI0021E722B2|nr:hypothetical protein [Salinibacter grassmerensis]